MYWHVKNGAPLFLWLMGIVRSGGGELLGAQLNQGFKRAVGVGPWGPGGVAGAPWGGDGLGELFPGCGGEFAGVHPN